ncbi:MAG: hypothetical protein JNJ59_20570 [Deltaproteobacteria bacterium]|nr:hypothetical protein [Deltaproteobacteria bacterium]
MTTPPPASRPDPEAPPPFLGTWPRVYLAVVASQVVFVLALFGFARACS